MTIFIPDFIQIDTTNRVDLENSAFDYGQEIKTIAETMEKDIPEGDCSLAFRLQLRSMATQIVNRLKEMALTGFTAANLKQVVAEGRAQLNALQTDFRSKSDIARQKTDELSHKMFESKERINKCEFSPENFIMPTLSSSTDILFKAQLLKNSDELQCSVENCVKNLATGEASSLIKKTLGKTTATSFKIGTKLTLSHAPENSENKTRDLIIYTGCSTAVSEAVGCLLKCSPLSVTLRGISLTHDVADIMEVALKDVENNEKLKLYWNMGSNFSPDMPSFEGSIAISKACFAVAKAPGALLRAAQCEVSSAIAGVADSIGLTEENIEKTVDLLKQYPELLNDTFY